jgi:hypothetical protein
MASSETWFIKIELELTTGRSITFSLTRDETVELAKRFFVQESLADDVALTRAAFTTLLERIDRRNGEIVLPAVSGQLWIIPAASIVAGSLETRLDAPGRKTAIVLGFHGKQYPPAGA